MSWENHQVFVKRIELLANRGDDLVKVSALKIGAANTAVEERITAKHAIGRAYKANTAAGMAGSMQHLERQCAKGDAVSFFQQDIGLALDERGFAPVHLRGALIAVHRDIIRMNSQWHGVDRAHFIDSADMVDMSMRVENIPGDKVQFLDLLEDARRFVAGIDNYRFACLRAGVQITILLKDAYRYTRDERPLFVLYFGHVLC